MGGVTTVLGSAPSVDSPAGTVRPPRWPVLAATACLGLSGSILALAVFGDQSASVQLTGLGYGLGSIGVSLLVVVHRMLKQKAEQSLWYEPRRRLAVGARVVLTLGLLVGLGNAFFLASEIAKR